MMSTVNVPGVARERGADSRFTCWTRDRPETRSISVIDFARYGGTTRRASCRKYCWHRWCAVLRALGVEPSVYHMNEGTRRS